MKKPKEIMYEYIIDKETIKELKEAGLNENGIIAFADNILGRYFYPEYLNPDDISAFNEEE